MKSKDIFTIDGLGDFTYLVTLIEIDYPISFVAKRMDGNDSLFLFDQFDSDDESITWICTQISFQEFDDLNKGTRTLENCFRGPRNGAREGYLVVSRESSMCAESRFVEDISQYADDDEVFVEPFADEKHSAGPLSLFSQSKIMSIVLDDARFASPFIEATRIENTAKIGKGFVNNLPFMIEKPRAHISYGSSIVINFEINDKVNPKNNSSLVDEEAVKEADDAFDAIKIISSEESKEEDIIDAFQGDINSIQKYNNLLDELKQTSKKKNVILQLVDNCSSSNDSVKSINLNSIEKIKERNSHIVKMIEESGQSVFQNDYHGEFLMLDSTSSKRFKFKASINQENVVLKGKATIDFDSIDFDLALKRKYIITVKETKIVVKEKIVKTLYEMIDLKPDFEAIDIFAASEQ